MNKNLAQGYLSRITAICLPAMRCRGLAINICNILELTLFLLIFTGVIFSIYLPEASASVAMGSHTRSPPIVRQSASPSLRLESMVVEVNGERRRVDPATGFVVVRGDLVTVIDGWLLDKSKTIPLIDFVGFKSKIKTISQGDRGKVIDTNHDLDARQSIDGKGNRYEIRALGSGVLYGSVTMIIEAPTLFSFEVEVNGERRKLTAGDKLSLGPHDGVRVTDVRTNIRGNENVLHELSSKKGGQGRILKEIRFTRGDVVFARIPIEWQGQ